jgi:DNA-binding beta-propeller fold protein YncE
LLFSVYARTHKGAFIHALNLAGPFALCLDLPGAGYQDGSQESLDWSLVLSPDGNRLYATNPAMGVVAEFDANNVSSRHTFQVDEPSHAWPAGAVVSADSRTLVIAGSTGVAWLDTTTMQPVARALAGWTVRSLALSPDGRTLYAVDDKGTVAELSMSGHTLTSTFDPRVDHPIALMRVEALP